MLQQLMDCQYYKTFASKSKKEKKKGQFIPIMAYLNDVNANSDMFAR